LDSLCVEKLPFSCPLSVAAAMSATRGDEPATIDPSFLTESEGYRQ
jgi:hypothetical protein